MTEENFIDKPWLKSYSNKVSWDQDIPSHPVYEILEKTVADFPDRPAFSFLGHKQNWSDIGEQVQKLAKGLQTIGVKKGTRVGLFLPNCPYFLIAYYAVLKAGGTLVNFNPLYAEREIETQLNDSETEIMITADIKMLYEKIEPMLQKTTLKKIVLCPFADYLSFPKNILFSLLKGVKVSESKTAIHYKTLLKNDGHPDPVEIDPHNDIALLQYTGGTTGLPKGAMLTHANVVANVEQSVMWFHEHKKGEEKMLGVLPFFHVFAMTCVMNFAVKAAFEIVSIPRFELKDTLKLITKEKPHYFPAVPAIYNAINNTKDLKKYDLKSLKYCISGGAALPVEVKKTFESLTGCVVVEGYGLSESSPVVCANPINGDNRPGSIGLPFPGTTVEIINRDDGETAMPIGERGELCVRGPQVMKGYWKREEETAATLKGHRLHTGDVATMDEDGYVYIVDRIKDVIITNGYNIYPRHVEEAIYLHDAVEECIVAGLPDKNRGEIAKAWIKPKDGRTLDADELKKFLEDKISKIEMPRRIEIRTDPLPKTMIGKLSRKDIVAEELEKMKQS